MNIATFLQAFLFFDIFVAGMVVATAARHWYAHRHPAPKLSNLPATTSTGELPAAMRERLVQDSQLRFQAVLNKSTIQLQGNLQNTSAQLDALLKRMGAEIVGNELERYRVELAQLRTQAQTSMQGVSAEVASHRAELEAELEKEFAAEKQHLTQQIDTKLSDAVASFLLETLQHNVDLGAQEPYLKAMLEEHKADFKNEVEDEPSAT